MDVERSPLRRRAMREERDSLGPVAVPEGRLWGAQTERSRAHFAIGADAVRRWPRSVLRAFGIIKAAAAEANRDLAMIGRTHLQDATPIMLGDVDASWGAQVADAARRITESRDRLHDLPLGATAVGTGLNAHPW